MTLVRDGHHEDWNIPDPKNLSDDECREVRDPIDQKVKKFLANLSAVRG